MKYLSLVISLCSLQLLATMSCGQETAYLSDKISQKYALEDFDHFRRALEEGSAAMYWYKDSLEVAHIFDSLRNQVTDNITNAGFHTVLTSAMEAISCGHSTITFSESYYNYVNEEDKYLPLQVKVIEGKLYVLKNFSDQNIEQGSEIVDINGIKASEIINKLSSKIPSDKGINSMKIRTLDYVFPFYFALHFGVEDQFEIQFLQPTSTSMVAKTLTAITAENMKLVKSRRHIYKGELPIEFKIDYLTINTFQIPYYKNAKIDFNDFLESTFEEISKAQIENLVIDVRDNIGGHMEYGETLLSYISNTPANYFRNGIVKKRVADGDYTFTKIPASKKQFEKMFEIKEEGDCYVMTRDKVMTPTKFAYNGDLYVITNGLSFSTTACFLAQIKDKNRGVLIGEMPGGAYSGLSTSSPFVKVSLPNTKYNLYFRFVLINLDVAKNIDNINVDYEVNPSIDDIVNGVDTELQFVNKLIADKM